MGFDIYGDHLNLPAFFALQPAVIGLAEVFIADARQPEADKPPGIAYQVASALALPFVDGAFDFATTEKDGGCLADADPRRARFDDMVRPAVLDRILDDRKSVEAACASETVTTVSGGFA